MSEDLDEDDDLGPDEPDTLDPDFVHTCWCGAQGTYEDLFAPECLEEGCGGTGSLNCFCGGDQCVCHFHGETECTGCEDCCDDYENDYTEDFDDDSYYDDDPDDERP